MPITKTISKVLLFFAAFILIISTFGITNVHAQVNGNDYGVVTTATSSSDDETGLQRIKLEIKSGKYTNTFFDVSFKPPTSTIKRDLQKGDIVLVKFNTTPPDDKIQSVEIVDLYRVPNIFWAPLLFILILLVTAIAKYRRKVYIFLAILISVVLPFVFIIFLKAGPGHLNMSPSFLFVPLLAIGFCVSLYLLYKKWSISIIGLAVPIILSIIALLLAFISLQLASVQLSFLSIISSFYDVQNSDFTESYYYAVLLSSLIGAVYIAYQQILETVKIKISDNEITKRELSIKSFRNTIKNMDNLIFPSIGFLGSITLAVLLYLTRSVGIESALNNDYWVSILILCCISFIVWIITVPICALLCGMILGRLEQHKIVTDKTISILD